MMPPKIFTFSQVLPELCRMVPPMGATVTAGTAIARSNKPSRYPISGSGDTAIGRTPERLIKAPDVKPNVMEKPMTTDECVAGIQMANIAIPEIAQAMMNIFHLPILSEM